MTHDEINDRVMSGAPCCGQCGEWLKGSENFCPQCGCQQLDTSAVDGPGVNLAAEAQRRPDNGAYDVADRPNMREIIGGTP